MNIRAKLTFRFSIIVASIMVLFSIAIYLFSAQFRREEFYDRLESKALTTARLLVTVEEVDKELLRIIDQNSVPNLPEEKIEIYNSQNELIYCSVDSIPCGRPAELLARIKQTGHYRFVSSDAEQVGLVFKAVGGGDFVVFASAFDRYGRRKLANLGTVLIAGLLVGIGIIFLAGRVFAQQVLSPLARMNHQVSLISAGNLDRRIEEGNQTDEIAQLAMNFNRMLQRIETAFEVQQSFVSNASHELRTPLAAMRSQLQVTLAKHRSADEYRLVLQSLLDDTNNFAKLTKGLLMLAQSSVDTLRNSFQNLRADEVLFGALEELAKLQPDYHFHLAYESMPENETALTVRGNEQLLSTAFINIMDNACKFSLDRSVYISLATKDELLEICFRDNGIGIPAGEEVDIFSPFYRAENGQTMAKGHGIGLSLCQKIIQLHAGSILVESSLGKGSTFRVWLPAQ